MPTPSKFTEDRRKKILQVLSIGGSRVSAAATAGVDEATFRRWMVRGKESDDGTRWRDFYDEVIAAEAAPRVRALGIVYKELPDNPALAWKYLERREPGYAPPMPDAVGGGGPVVIQLAFAEGSPVPLPSTSIDVLEVVAGDAEDAETDPDPDTDP